MPFATNNDSLIIKRPHAHKVILTTSNDVSTVRTPTNAEKPSKVAPHPTIKFLLVEIVDSEESILANHGKVRCVGRKFESVDASMADLPTKEKMGLAFWLARMDDSVCECLVWNKGGRDTGSVCVLSRPYV